MNQSKRIDPLLKRAQEHEDAVARDLAERQRVLDTHLSRLDELRRYAEEYGPVRPTARRRAFLDRLDSAVEQQQATVNAATAKSGGRARAPDPGQPWRCWSSWPPATARRKR